MKGKVSAEIWLYFLIFKDKCLAFGYEGNRWNVPTMRGRGPDCHPSLAFCMWKTSAKAQCNNEWNGRTSSLVKDSGMTPCHQSLFFVFRFIFHKSLSKTAINAFLGEELGPHWAQRLFTQRQLSEACKKPFTSGGSCPTRKKTWSGLPCRSMGMIIRLY